MEQVKTMRCGLCNGRTDVKEMRYHKSGEYLICGGCHDKQTPGAKVVVQKPAIREVGEVAKKREKVSYRCKNCSYAFTRAKDHPVLVCPYCGRDGVSLVEGSMAQHLIDKNFL